MFMVAATIRVAFFWGSIMKTYAAVMREKSGPFSIEKLNLAEPREDEVFVRIHGRGICHTDVVVCAEL